MDNYPTTEAAPPYVQCNRCGEDFRPNQSQLSRQDYRCGRCRHKRSDGIRRAPRRKPAREKVSKAKIRYELYKNDPEYRAKERERKRRQKQNPVEKAKNRARELVRRRRLKGEIKQLPCQVCGKEPSEPHHEDYSKPLDVIWLCIQHHREADRSRRLRERGR